MLFLTEFCSWQGQSTPLTPLSCSSRSPVLSDISTLARSANIPDITFQTLALSQSVDVEYWYKIAGFFQLIQSLGM